MNNFSQPSVLLYFTTNAHVGLAKMLQKRNCGVTIQKTESGSIFAQLFTDADKPSGVPMVLERVVQ